MKRQLYPALLLLGAHLLAAAPEDYRYFAELVPPGEAVANRLNSIQLDNAVWPVIAGVGDMRLYSQDGRELPFQAEPRVENGSALCSEQVPGTVVSFDLDGRKAVILVQVGKEGKGARVDSLTLRTAERNFEKRVSISGRDGGAWRLLVKETPFFDRNPRFALRRISFEFPAGFYRELKIEIDNYGEEYVSRLRRITEGEAPESRRQEREVLFRELKIDDVVLRVKNSVKFSGRPLEQTFIPEIRSISTDPETKSTIIEFDCRKIPLNRLKLLTADTNFSREAEFETSDGAVRKTVRLESLSIPGYSRRATDITFQGEPRFGRCRLTLRNSDSPPLEQLALKGYGPVYHLITLAPDIPAKLCYGGNGVAPGEYDLGRTLSGVNTALLQFNEYRCGSQQRNPDFRETAEGVSQLFTSKWIFPAVVVFLALVLALFIARNIRHVEKSRDDD